MALIVLDAGHGGRDPGAVGRDLNLHESAVNLAVVLHAGDALEGRGHRVIYTRRHDEFIPIGTRAQIANNAGAEWFVSVHCNSFADRAANGTETFHYPGSAVAQQLASHVNSCMVERLGRRNRGVKEGRFQVIRQTRMPSCLAEVAFISNPEEERLLADPAFQARAGDAIATGILAMAPAPMA